MAYPWYRTGSVAVTNGSAAVVGTTTGWANPSYAREGDLFFLEGVAIGEVASVESNTELTLREPFAGSSDTGLAYSIAPVALSRYSVGALSFDLATFLASVTQLIGGTAVPDDTEDGENGWGYVRSELGVALEYYRKSGGSWGSPISMIGPPGPAGPSYAGTSTTSLTVGTGTRSLTVTVGLAFVVGSRMRLASTANPTTVYMEGPVTAHDPETGALSFTSDKAVGAGTVASWKVSLAGDTGSKGDTGASFGAASTSSLLIATGAKVFVVPAGLAFTAGQRVRAASAANPDNYMEGPVASYIGTNLTVTVQRTLGAGTLADWTINVIGQPGATGPGYMATSTTSRTLGTGTMSFTTQENLAYSAGARVRFSSASDPAGQWMEGPTNSYSGTAISVDFDDFAGSGAHADWNINLAGEKGQAGDAATITVGTVTTVAPGEPATVTNTGDENAAVLDFEIPQGEPGDIGPAGPNTGLDYAWDTGTTDSDPGVGDIRVDDADWTISAFAYVSKTGRNGEALGTVIAALCGANNAHRAHLRLFPIADRSIYLEAEIENAIVDGGDYWKLPLSGISASVVMPAASDVLCLVITRSGEAAASGADALVHAMLGGL